MSRGLLRSGSDSCADCNAPEPTWASINRGVLVCDECCSVHRSLGRHISHVKSLKKGSWSPTQLTMVHQLVSFGVNSIWEHSLLDPSQNKHGKKKPTPRDPIHPTKADFIRAKYQFLAYSNKQKESEVASVEDLSKQLHSSVRTSNLETSLRLLSLGADANYFHTERGTCPLHMAAQAGQTSQVELLVVYGADAGGFDANGRTPVDHARMEGHKDLADRLVECQYELTDRLAFYLCGRKPDHRVGQHFIIPEVADRYVAGISGHFVDGNIAAPVGCLDISELAKAAKKKLQALSNTQFTDLAMDVYDEVDRRENETIWMSTQNHTSLVSDRQIVPFLPVNPEFSSTRNQGRQKLARFNAREFATLIIDILNDTKRRLLGTSSSSATITKDREKAELIRDLRTVVKTNSIISDDEPLYDSVCSDEDYASIGDSQDLKEEKPDRESTKEKTAEIQEIPPKGSGSPSSMISFTESMASSEQSDTPITLEEYLDVKRSLAESEARVTQLVQTNKDLKQEIMLLHNMVSRVMQENQTLMDGGEATGQCAGQPGEMPSESELRSVRAGSRPMSMFEARDPQRHHKLRKQQIKEESSHQEKAESADNKKLSASPSRSDPGGSDYDNANHGSRSSSARSSGRSESITPTDLTQENPADGAIGGSTYPDGGEDLALPSQDDVVKKTEKITKKIQELLVSAQQFGKQDSYAACSERIFTAVEEMSVLFPQSIQDERIQAALSQLTGGAERLRDQCNKLNSDPEDGSQRDSRLHTQQVIQCAYDIAKAAKQLVLLFE